MRLSEEYLMQKRLRWAIGFVCLAVLAGLIFFYPINSLLEWQSPLLKRFFFILFICALLCLFRVMKGPTPADRAVAIDILGILVLGFCAILSVVTGRGWYIDIGIAWALQSFISTLALAKYLEGRDFHE